MLRNLTVLIILMLSVSILATGCSTPSEPVELTYGGNSQPEEDPTEPPPPTIGLGLGDVAPDFTLPDSYGDDVALSSLRGGPVLLFFWATGCVYCEEQYPRMQAFHEDYADSLTVMAINLDDDPQLINAYLGDRGLTFPCLVASGDLQQTYDVYSVPHALLLDDEGIVTFNNHPGYLSEVALQEEF